MLFFRNNTISEVIDTFVPPFPFPNFPPFFLLQLFSCEDLFDEDTAGLNYDTTTPAGKDEYPYINIYGSCKTCEAYVLDYFAEEAFESVEEHKTLAIVYMTAAVAGFIFSIVSFVKYRVSPTAENEIELLGSDGGVLA